MQKVCSETPKTLKMQRDLKENPKNTQTAIVELKDGPSIFHHQYVAISSPKIQTKTTKIKKNEKVTQWPPIGPHVSPRV